MAKKGGSDGGAEAAQARADEQARQAAIRQGTANIANLFDSQFTPAYFDAQRDAYVDYATPQLTDQTNDAKKQLTYSLARRGALDSSSRADLEAQLERKAALAAQQIKDQGDAYKTTAMNNVEQAREGLIQTLNATGDAQGAVNSATARAQALSQTPAYSPLAALFADFTSGLGQQAAAERAFAYGAGPRPTYQTGLFGAPSGAVVNG